MNSIGFAASALGVALATGIVFSPDEGAFGQTPTPSTSPKPAIVLVHGAFADGSSWRHVIPLLERDGYKVTAVQNALTSLAEDVATTKRVIEAQKGPVIVVGHSYGGAVITGAAAGEPNVKALVYIAAFAPDSGEPVGALNDKYPTSLGQALRPDPAGFVYIDRAQFHAIFCADVPKDEADVMAATQKPLAASVFGESVPVAAWRTIPSWYVVSELDHAINPDQERFFAERMHAHTSEFKGSHVGAFMAHPMTAVSVIEQAAVSVSR